MAASKFQRSRLLGAWALLLVVSSSLAGASWLQIELISGYTPQRLQLTGFDLQPSVSALLLLQTCMIAVLWFIGRLPRIVLSALGAVSTVGLIAATLPIAFGQNVLGNPGAVRSVAKATGIADVGSQSAVISGSNQDVVVVALAVLAMLLLLALQVLIALTRKPWAPLKSYERGGASQSKTGEKPDSASLWDAQA